jgi:hypothetical protein
MSRTAAAAARNRKRRPLAPSPGDLPIQVYFDCADEVYESIVASADQTVATTSADQPLTLADLDARFIAEAKIEADEHRLPWPPYLPDAEEWALDWQRRDRAARDRAAETAAGRDHDYPQPGRTI